MLKFFSKKITAKQHSGKKTYIADMESDGVYFSDHEKEILEKERENGFCNYSGLPSVSAYSTQRISEVNSLNVSK